MVSLKFTPFDLSFLRFSIHRTEFHVSMLWFLRHKSPSCWGFSVVQPVRVGRISSLIVYFDRQVYGPPGDNGERGNLVSKI